MSHHHNTFAESRRKFLGRAGAAIACGALTSQWILESSVQAHEPVVFQSNRHLHDYDHSSPPGSLSPDYPALSGVKRANRAYSLRLDAAQEEREVPIPPHPDNGDESRYQNYIGNYSKGLKHDRRGEVIPSAYEALLGAVQSGRFRDVENLRPFIGSPDPSRQRPLVNPEAANSYDLEGTDPGQLAIPPAPAFSSDEEAGEMVELYWMALLRDVNFDDYPQNPIAQAAADDLSRLSHFHGPTKNGRVTTRTLFRDEYPGCTTGPYISQFLLKQTNFGAQFLDQRIVPRAPGTNYMTNFQEWLDVQNGIAPANLNIPGNPQVPARFVSNGRDISQYVRLDFLYQAYFVATLILLNGATLNETTSPFLDHFPFDRGNPYGPQGATFARAAFGTFGNPHIATLVTEPATRALKAVWYQKWNVHRRLRPEAFGGRVEVVRQGRAQYPIHRDLFRSSVLTRIFNQYGSHLLPQAFPEGSPLHPSYGSGHATVAGACVTVLKAFFDEFAVIENPVRINPADGGQTTIPYEGPELTVGGDLNKLASNIATGRNSAGVHWRSDGVEGVRLGEAVGISILRDMRRLYGEPYSGFTLTKFDGKTIKV